MANVRIGDRTHLGIRRSIDLLERRNSLSDGSGGSRQDLREGGVHKCDASPTNGVYKGTHLRTESSEKTLPSIKRRRGRELRLRDSLLEVLSTQRASGLQRLDSSLAGGLDVRAGLALDEKTEERRVRVREKDRAH